MRVLRAVFAILLVLAPPAAAAPATIDLPHKTDTIVLPAGSGLKFYKFDSDNQAHFLGRLVLHGTYYYGPNQIDDGTNGMTLYFVPDDASAAQLPYLKMRGRPHDMVLTNANLFADNILPWDIRDKLAVKGNTLYATGPTTIVVQLVTLGLVCDAPAWSAFLFGVFKHAPVALGPMPDSGC